MSFACLKNLRRFQGRLGIVVKINFVGGCFQVFLMTSYDNSYQCSIQIMVQNLKLKKLGNNNILNNIYVQLRFASVKDRQGQVRLDQNRFWIVSLVFKQEFISIFWGLLGQLL
eukprot:TRINITY_DN57451_c0_g1_i4.p9 TRINITY_DN57451_c0_g1~~TRINITY_DN57451_c0_g1_i4.p9  ORF type:complete len:113 (-),score=7.59 TRINITY_DN57451_c0_g1_i4:574-912(-)